MSLEGKRVIVTGGTDGIGLATVRHLHARGCQVTVVARRPEPAAQLVAELGGERIATLSADVRDDDAPRQAIALTTERFGGIDGLVNNAAQDHFGPLLEVPDSEIRHVMEMDLVAPLRMLRDVARVMAAQGTGGSIVNLSSRLGTIGVPTMGYYGAAKGGLNAFTRHAAVELAPHRIRVNTVAPGMTETPLIVAWLSSFDDPVSQRAAVEATVPQGRMGSPAEVAATIGFLLSDDAPHITGAHIAIDGGYTAQ
jgi:NAD(P)-dependent dehydrogenase (short-subunit alcohol dehydrogenase family)